MKSKDPYCLVIGSSNLDISGTSSKKLLLYDSNESDVFLSSGGVGRNVAENIIRLGNRCFLISAFGDDQFGKYIKKNCIKIGLDISASITTKKGNTALYLSVHENTGEMVLALNDTSIINNITPKYLEKHRRLISESSVIVIDTNLSQRTMNYIFRNFSQIPIFVDPVSLSKSKKVVSSLKFIHTLKPNLFEAKFLAGIKNKTKNNPEDIAQKLSQKGLKRFLISLGEKGVFAYNDKIGKYYESELLSFKNDTGAGDALLAGLVHGHLKGWSWDYTIKFSLITANFALKVKETVNSNLNERDVLKVLEENYERRK